MKKTFDFGKIALRGGRRINRVTVDVELREDVCENGPEFSVRASVWNTRGTDITMGGQCLEELQKYLYRDETFRKILRLWKANHLNTMHAGTFEQEKAVAEHFAKTGKRYDYAEACEALKKRGLYEVPDAAGGTYKYGHAWLYWPISESDLAEIRELLKEDA